MTPEALARQTIDTALCEAGWAVQDVSAINLFARRGVAVREFPLKAGHRFSVLLMRMQAERLATAPKWARSSPDRNEDQHARR